MIVDKDTFNIEIKYVIMNVLSTAYMWILKTLVSYYFLSLMFAFQNDALGSFAIPFFFPLSKSVPLSKSFLH